MKMSPDDELQNGRRIPQLATDKTHTDENPLINMKTNGKTEDKTDAGNDQTQYTRLLHLYNNSHQTGDGDQYPIDLEIRNNNKWNQSNGNGGYKNCAGVSDDISKNNNESVGSGKNGISLLEQIDPLSKDAVSLHKNTFNEDGLELDGISSCGIGKCQPKWARFFASTYVFMIVFLLAWVLQGMFYTYFVSVITTIEKLFQIKSKVTGMLMSTTEIGQICTALFLTYYAGRGHRPRWIACGMTLFATAAFMCTLPHFIYGDQLLHSTNIFNGGSNMQSPADVAKRLNLCTTPVNGTNKSYECDSEILVEQSAHSQITTVVLCIFFMSLLGIGVGQTAVATLGIPYIDDNVASRESPIYLAITIGVRILGPAFGFIVGSFCTRLYVNLEDPGYGTSDPKWVGAWWLGILLISCCMILAAIAMFNFPKHLKGNRIPPPEKLREIEAAKKLKQQEEDSRPKLRDFPKAIKRQLKNDILMFRTASSVLHLLPIAGLYTFLPKYLESQFRLATHDAALISGIGGIMVMGIGIFISGFVILKSKPTARSVAAWIAFTAIVYSAGMAILMFVGCPMDDFKALMTTSSSPNDNPLQRFEFNCTETCDCDMNKFSPVCGSNGMTYYSSCHAGCKASTTINGRIEFTNCTCIENSPSLLSSIDGSMLGKPDAISGFCGGECKSYILFISLFSFFVFMHSTSEVGSILLIMRCTDPKDKAMAMGIIQFAIGLFGNVPCPIIYGAVVDSACLVWDTLCGKQGACALYDADMFRHFYLGATAAFMFLAFIMDIVVWHKAHRIDIDPESTSEIDHEKANDVPESAVSLMCDIST